MCGKNLLYKIETFSFLFLFLFLLGCKNEAPTAANRQPNIDSEDNSQDFSEKASKKKKKYCVYNGQQLPYGASTTGYSSPTVPYGSSCSSVAKTVTCKKGVMYPGGTYPTCSVEAGPEPTPAPTPVPTAPPAPTPVPAPTPTPDPNAIQTKAGYPIKLYDNVMIEKPAHANLIDKGFDLIYTWDGNYPKTTSFDAYYPPTKVLEDNSPEQVDLVKQIDNICANYIDPVKPTLFVLDIEWDIITSDQTDPNKFKYSVSGKELQNLNNLATIIRWTKTHLNNVECGQRVRLGVYGSLPVNWWLDYIGDRASWLNSMEIVFKKVTPYVDVLTPSYYAPYSRNHTPGVFGNDASGKQITNEEFWANSVTDSLKQLETLNQNLQKPIAPFMGLRYYFEKESSPYYYKYVEQSFIEKMFRLFSDPKFKLGGIILWDWHGFGRPTYANDGTDVWPAVGNPDWYTATINEFIFPKKP